MERLTENKIILVTSMTRLESLKTRFNSVTQAKFYVEHLGADFNDYIKEDEIYNSALDKTMTILNKIGRLHVVQRQFLPNFMFGKNDIIVAIGRDGLVANTLKYLNGQPCFGVNPDPDRWDGVLLPFNVSNLYEAFTSLFENKCAIKEVTMAKATLQNGECLYGVNDLFVGSQSHISARYSIAFGEEEEKHSSSGIIISTGLGSTAWLKSIITGATKIVEGITPSTKGKRRKNHTLDTMTWDANYLYFSVREPFPSITSSTDIVFGKITNEKPLIISSLMPDYGVIFSDGIQQDFITFTSGIEAIISIAEKKGRLVV